MLEKFVIYKDRAGKFRWTLFARNGKKVACSGEGYSRKIDCHKAIEMLSWAPDTEIEEKLPKKRAAAKKGV